MALQFLGTLANPARTVLTQPITPGIIIAATINATSDIDEPFLLYAECGIAHDNQTAPVTTKIVLAKGYISRQRPISWSGFYLMHPNDHFYLTLAGDLTQSVNADVRRLPNIATKTLEEILATVLIPA